jgi:DNA-binding MarR family transcriptional regulator
MSSGRPNTARHSAIILRQSLTRLQRCLRDALPPPSAATASQLSVLGLLFRHGELTPGELARREGVRVQTLTRLLAGLEAEGWVHRQVDASDGRRHLLALTGAGRKLLTAYVHQREASLEDAITAEFNDAEQRRLLVTCDLLDRLSARLQQCVDRATVDGERA